MDIFGIGGLTPKELYIATNDFSERYENDQKNEWEVMRRETFVLRNLIASIMGDKQLQNIQYFMSLPWDKTQKKEQTVEEQKHIFETLFGPGIPLKERRRMEKQKELKDGN